MIVYATIEARDPEAPYTIHIAPGAEAPEVSDFLHPDGIPKTISVVFENGRAEVPDNLGRYLIDKGYAQKTRLFLGRRR